MMSVRPSATMLVLGLLGASVGGALAGGWSLEAHGPLYAGPDVILTGGTGPLQAYATATQKPLWVLPWPCPSTTDNIPRDFLPVGKHTLAYTCAKKMMVFGSVFHKEEWTATSLRTVDVRNGNVTMVTPVDKPHPSSESSPPLIMEAGRAAVSDAQHGVYCIPTSPTWCLFGNGDVKVPDELAQEAGNQHLHLYSDSVVVVVENSIFAYDATSGKCTAAIMKYSTIVTVLDAPPPARHTFAGRYTILTVTQWGSVVLLVFDNGPAKAIVARVVPQGLVGDVSTRFGGIVYGTAAALDTPTSASDGVDELVVAIPAFTTTAEEGSPLPQLTVTTWRVLLSENASAPTGGDMASVVVQPQGVAYLTSPRYAYAAQNVLCVGTTTQQGARFACSAAGSATASATVFSMLALLDGSGRVLEEPGQAGAGLDAVQQVLEAGDGALVVVGGVGGVSPSTSGAVSLNAMTGAVLWQVPFGPVGPNAMYDASAGCTVLQRSANEVVCVNATGGF